MLQVDYAPRKANFTRATHLCTAQDTFDAAQLIFVSAQAIFARPPTILCAITHLRLAFVRLLLRGGDLRH